MTKQQMKGDWFEPARDQQALLPVSDGKLDGKFR